MPHAESIKIYVPDKTYGGDDWETESPKFRDALVKLFDQSFEEIDLGTGASELAFWTTLVVSPPIVAALAIFFNGKRIEENLDAWQKLYKRLTGYLEHRAVFDRDGAAILAIEGIRSALGKLPSSVRLVGYHTDSLFNRSLEEAQSDNAVVHVIGEPLSWVRAATMHIFQIEADGEMFKVIVQGPRVVTAKIEG
jgi:hypothetical protein